MMTAEHCCLDDCCGPGSWCCERAHSHTHTSDENALDESRPLGAGHLPDQDVTK